jgi:pumilio RNA-binding family
MQKLIEVVAPERLTFLPVICDNILELATHPYGCRVLQRCLEHLPKGYTRSLLDAIHCHTVDLMRDQYGVSLNLLIGISKLTNLTWLLELCHSVHP